MFGKHPVRADHWQVGSARGDAGRVRGVLYDGIDGNVRDGRWEGLAAELRLPAFGHDVIARICRTAVVCRVSASVDRTGTRASFPLVCCVACPWKPDLSALLGIAGELDQAIRSGTDEPTIGGAVALADAALDDLEIDRTPDRQHPKSPRSVDWLVGEIAALLRDSSPAPSDTVLRTAWTFCRRFAPFLDVAIPAAWVGDSAAVPQAIRVEPRDGLEQGVAHVAWAQLMGAALAPQTDFWIFGTTAPQWLDIVVGTPSAEELFLLLATPAHTPAIGSVPLRGIEDDFKATVDRVLSGVPSDRRVAAECAEPPSASASSEGLSGGASGATPERAFEGTPEVAPGAHPADHPPA